jgi:predicted nucleotidyltransferase
MNYKIYSVDEIKKRFGKVAGKYGIEQAFLFGSYARGKATRKSDVDICIKGGNMRTLFQFGGFYADVQDAMKKNIDVIDYDEMYSGFKTETEKEFVKIYG